MSFTKIAAAGIGSTETVTLHSLEVLNNATVGGVLTYEDVTNVDSIGIITARAGVLVGSGVTLSKDGDGFFTGVTTATTFVGALTGNVTGNVTGNISGGTVAGSTGTFTGDVDIADKIVHTGDTNTSIRFPSSDEVTVETAGTERLSIEPAGNAQFHNYVNVGSGLTVGGLGAGTSLSTRVGQGFLELARSSGDAYIDFKNAFADDFDSRIITNAANQLQFFTGGQGATKCALQTGTGKVAISTDTPPQTSAKLEIRSDKLGATAGNTQEFLYMLSPDISNATSYRFTNYRHTNGTSHTSSEGRLRRHVDATDMGFVGFGDGYVNFGYGTAEKMRMNSSGRVGIGEDSPDALLHLSTGASATCELRLTANNTGSGAGDRGRINVYSALNDGTAFQAGYVDIDRSSGTDDIAHLLVALNDGSSVNERVRIHADGEVEIKQGAEGQTVLSAVANYASSGNVDIATFARSGGAVKSAIRYNDATTDMSFGTTTSHGLKIMAGGSGHMLVQPAGHVLFNQTSTHVPGLANTTVGASMEDVGATGSALFISRGDSISLFLNRNNAGQMVSFRQSGSEVGSISTNGNSLPSDRNFKKNITDLTLGLDFVNTLKPSKFNLKLEEDTDPLSYGLIAQDVEESLTAAGISKNSVALLKHDPKESESESDYNLDYGKLIPVLINAIKELSTKVASLEG